MFDIHSVETTQFRAVKKFVYCRLIMNSRRLWNSHQRHKFLMAKSSRDILKFRVSEMAFSRGFQEEFSTTDTMLFCQNIRRTRTNTVEMSQGFHDIAWFEHFTDLNLFKYAFSVMQNWEMDALQFYSMVPIFC